MRNFLGSSYFMLAYSSIGRRENLCHDSLQQHFFWESIRFILTLQHLYMRGYISCWLLAAFFVEWDSANIALHYLACQSGWADWGFKLNQHVTGFYPYPQCWGVQLSQGVYLWYFCHMAGIQPKKSFILMIFWSLFFREHIHTFQRHACLRLICRGNVVYERFLREIWYVVNECARWPDVTRNIIRGIDFSHQRNSLEDLMK